MRLALATLAVVALAAGAARAEIVAIPALDFVDTSGEPPVEDREIRVERFAVTFRDELAAAGLDVVLPACEACTPAVTPFAEMAEAARASGADRLLVGNIRKISTLIGSIRLTLIDLPGDRVLCSRTLSYRGDTDEAFDRAARFAAEDMMRHCFS